MDIDLPDLSEWRFVDTLTLDEACLLWGAINPLDYEHIEGDLFSYLRAKMTVRDLRLKKALMARRLLVDGVCEGGLSTVEAWEVQIGEWDRMEPARLDKGVLPIRDFIMTGKTRVKSAVLTKYLLDKGFPSIKQEAERKRNEKNITFMGKTVEGSPTILIGPSSYKPKHNNPALEVLQEISQEIWDELNVGDKPPKALEIKEIIRGKYVEKTGFNPTVDKIENVVNQIDAIGRPPVFKGQEKKK